MDKTLIEEAEIIKLCSKGDRRAQMHLYDKYSRAMFNVALRVMNNDDDAVDMMQEAFIKAFSKLDMYNGEVLFGAWLKRIVVNTCLDELRKKKMEFSYDDERFLENVVDVETSQYDDEVLRNSVKEAIDTLPEKYSVIVGLYLIEGYDYQEIADLMGIREGTARSIVSRGKLQLREILDKEELMNKSRTYN